MSRIGNAALEYKKKQAQTSSLANMLVSQLTDEQRQTSFIPETVDQEIPPSPNTHSIEDALQVLKAQGFAIEKLQIKEKISYTNKTFEIETSLLKEFVSLQRALGFLAKQAANDALRDWCNKMRPEMSKPPKSRRK